jgi:hypothetical protein
MDPDPGGPKTSGSCGSGSTTLKAGEVNNIYTYFLLCEGGEEVSCLRRRSSGSGRGRMELLLQIILLKGQLYEMCSLMRNSFF